MGPDSGKQDVVRCDLCETTVPLLHCDICHVNLCKPCVGEHALYESKEHRNVHVLFEKRESIQMSKTFLKDSELHCEQCDCPICALCDSFFEHFEKKYTIARKSCLSKVSRYCIWYSYSEEGSE